jgi:hypothetical protein
VASVIKFAHTSPQVVLPLGHSQALFWQTMPLSHWSVQPPQLLGSVDVSTHTPPQKVRFGDAQESWHTPAMHGAPGGHECPHTPQL